MLICATVPMAYRFQPGSMVARRSSLPVRARRPWLLPITIVAMPILQTETWSIPDFDQSIKLDPTNAKPFSNRGAAYLRNGEYDLALKSLDQAIKLNPNYGRAFVNRAGAI
jgi:cytochrome c-type biogenesis protein CcmH/NrfG